MNDDTDAFAFAFGKPKVSGIFKSSQEDFKVVEQLGFELTGSGEHQCLYIEKRGLNTEELVKKLSKVLSKPIRSISYAGLKDRNAVTSQWISIHCPGESMQGVDDLVGDGWRVLASARHAKKIKHGAAKSNRFELVIREISDAKALEDKLFLIKEKGVPNYFGPQRFGKQGQNITKAESMLLRQSRVRDRFLRGMYFSAARSYLYNKILSARVEAGNWQQAIPGDVMQLSGSQSFFHIDDPDESIMRRLHEKDITPASILWGKPGSLATADALRIQQQALIGHEPLCNALEQHDLTRAYRAHTLDVESIMWEWNNDQLILEFTLVSGSYATSVLRELIV